MPMPAERRALIIDPAVAEPVRSAVGPVAWFVLESLAVTAAPGQRQVEVAAGTRQLAAAVSLSKDTVARGLRRLADAGLVERVDHRDSLSGRFGSTVYVVDLATAGLAVEHHDSVSKALHVSPHRATMTPRQPSPSPVDDHQLRLLD